VPTATARCLMKVLIVEDDPVIGKALHQGFAEAGHEGAWVKSGTRGLELARSQQFDAVILDLLLPGTPGLEVLKQLRAEGVRAPVILLTALGSVEDRVTGLNAGADDYVVKPFAFPELLARLEAVCRRAAPPDPTTLQVGELHLNLTTRRAHRAEAEIDLTPTEFSLLELLLRHAGQVVTRKMLCEHLWESDWEGTTNVIEVHINRLRNKLEKAGDPGSIQTVRGRGYAFKAPA
jgi:two-component system, OmpR family, response regulator